MATRSIPSRGHLMHRSHNVGRALPRLPVPIALDSGALFALALSAWAGLAPFIGPSFGYDPAGSSSLHWDLARAVLTVAPAVAGVIGSLFVLGSIGAWRHRGRSGTLGLGGLLLFLSGAWFALGSFAWLPIEHVRYLASSGPLDGFAAVVGIAIGPGLLLCALGGMVLGWRGGSPRLEETLATNEVSEVRDVPAPELATVPQDDEPIA